MTENERVKKVRKAKNLTLEKFGEQIEMGKSSISDIENGRRALTKKTRLLICEKFNVNRNWLETGEGGDDAMFLSTPQSDFDKFSKQLKLKPRDRILIEKFLALSDEGRQAVMDFALKVAEAVQSDAAVKSQPKDERGDEEDYADLARQQRRLEKERDGQALSAKESDVG